MDRSKKIRIIERVGVFVGTLLLVFFLFKFATFFMPFLIAGVIAVLIEPVIKFCMNKLKMSRRVSSVIIVVLTIILIITAVVYGGSAIIRELLALSKNIPTAIDSATEFINDATQKIEDVFPSLNLAVSGDVISGDASILQTSGDVLGNINSNAQTNANGINILEIMESSVKNFIDKLGTLISDWATNAIQLLSSVPTMIINVVITILALIFFTKDRIYVIDMLEHHMPKSWIRKMIEVGSEVFSTIGGYIRVYAKIIIITFAELYLAFTIINAIGFEIAYPLLLAIMVAIVDILPVLGVGTVLIPWAIWMFISGNIGFGFALLITYGVIFCIRQFIEPKLVSKQFGIHPLVTLFAMYAGYRITGVIGLILGPIFLMVLRCIFARQIERGLFKDIFEEK